MQLPTESEIREKAHDMGFTDFEIDADVRKSAAKSLIEEQQAAIQQPPRNRTEKILLSRQVVAHGDSHLIFEVWEQKENRAHD